MDSSNRNHCKPGAFALAALLSATLLFGGCKTTAPPVKSEPTAAERRTEALEALGFNQNDEGWLLRLPEPIWFQFNKATINPDMQHNLEGLADDLLKGDIHKLRIEGHSDNVGTHQANIDISMRRAEAVAQGFIGRGFDTKDIERVALGADHPTAPNDTREGRAQNRRVEIIVPANAVAEP